MTTALLLLSLVQGITLSGTVWQAAGKPAANADVQAAGSEGTFHTTSDNDGKFTFRLAKAGTFALTARLGKATSQASTIFVGQDMDGVGILLPPPTAPRPLVGSLRVDGEAPLPIPRPKIVVHYPSGYVANRCDITDIGLFFCPHPPEFTVTLEGLPESYFVKSVVLVGNSPETYLVQSIKLDDGDLVKKPINVTGNLSTSLIITLGLH
jgi:hypothetical protein